MTERTWLEDPESGERVEMKSPKILASDQIIDAQNDLDRHPSEYVMWPYPELDAVTGPLGAGGDVWFVCAFSGGGKTTFITSTIEAWRLMGHKVYVMPLETQPKRFRTTLACLETGIHPGDALSGLLRIQGRDAEREVVKAALYEQGQRPYVDQVMIAESEAIDVAGLERGCKEAVAFGAKIMIVDHIDHIDEDGDGRLSQQQISKKVNHAALRLAKRHDLLMVFASQLNMEIARNAHDRLAKYQPPRVEHVWMPGVKIQVCSGMIGLYRTLRPRHPGESVEDYADLLRRARKGEVAPTEVLDTASMGVNAMKLRNYGSREGTQITLGYHAGRVSSLPERDRYQTEMGGRIRRVA